jgi:RNA polymerase sigma factor (sigma-70 family)
MRRSPPQALQALLQADDDAAREHAWDDFIAEFSRLILHVNRSQTDSYDVAMDRYSFVLERLREGDFRRLRTYAADGRGKFSTWLVVVVRRLCADEARRRYGRDRGTSTDRRGRRDLVDLVGSEIDVNLLPDTAAALPSDAISAHELQEALAAALQQLDPSDRLVLKLRFQDDVSVAEIARMLSLPSVFHVYRRLNGIYDRLRAALRSLGVEDAAS